MPSHAQSHFQPPPPIRTSTIDSQQSQSSGAMSSDMLSPRVIVSREARATTSPTEESFFGAITTRMRRGRSRSRHTEALRKRSRSPMILPPEQFPSSARAPPMSPSSPPHASSSSSSSSSSRLQPRHASSMSQSSIASVSKPTRPSLQGSTRRSTNSSDMWRGRHSNSWLFNDFSVTDTAKDLFRKRSS